MTEYRNAQPNMAQAHPYGELMGRIQRVGLIAGVLGAVGCVAGLFVSVPHFFQGYLFAFVFWIGASLGCMAVLMIHHLNAWGWGFTTQRLLEAGALTVGLMAFLFIPLLFGLDELYRWANPELVLEDDVLLHKKPYLNVPFFIARAGLYFAIWCALAYFLRRWSLRQDATGDAYYAKRLRALSAGGLIAYVLSINFAATDWTMSLEPHWFSHVYGWFYAVGQTLTGLLVTVLVLSLIARRGPLARVFKTKYLHHYSTLVFTFVILWTYMMFVQFLIIWAGNLPEEIEWYVHRKAGGWGWVTLFLIIFHCAVPFALLLLRRVKRNLRTMRRLVTGLLAVHAVYVAWLIWPAFGAHGFRELSVHTFWIGGAALLGIGGLWAAVYAWQIARHPMLPMGDPRFLDKPASLHET